MITLGIANIQYGTYGESQTRFNENRIYQELLHKSLKLFNESIQLIQRFRFEQKFTERIGFRTRLRYKFMLKIEPFKKFEKLYFCLYDEVFFNGMNQTSKEIEVGYYDRNRVYIASGYQLNET